VLTAGAAMAERRDTGVAQSEAGTLAGTLPASGGQPRCARAGARAADRFDQIFSWPSAPVLLPNEVTDTPTVSSIETNRFATEYSVV
jgi:hypothetical protein